MKRKIILGLISISFILISCGVKRHFVKNENGKTIDKRLVGIWKGSESGNIIEGMSSEWEMSRNSNGTFTLSYIANFNGEKIEGIENGNWWIDNGLFYEFHEDSGLTDIYNYKVLNRQKIKFKAEKMAIEVVNPNYEFIDTKLVD